MGTLVKMKYWKTVAYKGHYTVYFGYKAYLHTQKFKIWGIPGQVAHKLWFYSYLEHIMNMAFTHVV